jgi:DNA-binding transcriptional MocR family regulator
VELVGSPAWPRHLRAVSAELKTRRDAMTAALRLHLPELALPHIPSGGYHLWLRLPDGTDEHAFTAAALRAGVAIAPGRPYFSAEPPAAHVRLSFAAVGGTAEITEGVRRLRAARDEVR